MLELQILLCLLAGFCTYCPLSPWNNADRSSLLLPAASGVEACCLCLTLSGACLWHCWVSDWYEHPHPTWYFTSAFTSLTDTYWPLIYSVPNTLRQFWNFPCVLEECEDESRSLASLYLYRVFEFLSRCFGSRPWSLGFSSPTLLVQCWQTQRAHLYKPHLYCSFTF